ncbi:hypothetical protein CFR75_05455 [Komagataeibacter xylinus]|uniref:Uncharacterized protein n=1 Tax=Komagataeibacter xylinus TaxID=28448 RepID=A0A318PVP4_KOMXY|nr:hypothetical protein [Komagataeibacter xylinus]AZV39808.1 hypothetical protein CXP35_14555 [Komagataeibacter xylinus]PYD57694.1 hypothetical protein CFR75_05455 [Komagataeibacter xylinus]GBQ74580.1 hypothetical protein AA15237_1918 [Komagataeibacter xylinus NBRC 15237]
MTNQSPKSSLVSEVNERVAVRMTIIFGSIWCVYGFLVFSLIPLAAPAWQNTLLYISNCIQLVALPALMVGNAVLSRGADQRAAEDHAALIEILNDVRDEVTELKTVINDLSRKTDEVANRPPSEVVSISDEAVINVTDEAPHTTPPAPAS